MEAETVTFIEKKEVKIVDCDGVPIREGSVLRRVNPEGHSDKRGVVVKILRKGDKAVFAEQIGDLRIRTSHFSNTVSNRYAEWQHIPRKDQTFEERCYSWLNSPERNQSIDGLYNSHVSERENCIMDGIFALFPADPIDWEFGEVPSSAEEALVLMARRMDEILKSNSD